MTAPMLSWLHRPDEDFGPLLTAGVDVGMSTVTAPARRRRRGPPAAAQPAMVQLKADTGLSRNGAARRRLGRVGRAGPRVRDGGQRPGARRLVAPRRRRPAGLARASAARWPRSEAAVRVARNGRAGPGAAAPGQLGRRAHRTARPASTSAGSASRSTGSTRSAPAAGRLGLRAGDDAAVHRGQPQAGAGRHRRLLRARPRHRRSRPRWPWCRSGSPTGCPGRPRVGPRSGSAARGARSSGASPWTSAWSTSATGRCGSATRSWCSAPGRTSRPSPSGPAGPAPTHTRCLTGIGARVARAPTRRGGGLMRIHCSAVRRAQRRARGVLQVGGQHPRPPGPRARTRSPRC